MHTPGLYQRLVIIIGITVSVIGCSKSEHIGNENAGNLTENKEEISTLRLQVSPKEGTTDSEFRVSLEAGGPISKTRRMDFLAARLDLDADGVWDDAWEQILSPFTWTTTFEMPGDYNCRALIQGFYNTDTLLVASVEVRWPEPCEPLGLTRQEVIEIYGIPGGTREVEGFDEVFTYGNMRTTSGISTEGRAVYFVGDTAVRYRRMFFGRLGDTFRLSEGHPTIQELVNENVIPKGALSEGDMGSPSGSGRIVFMNTPREKWTLSVLKDPVEDYSEEKGLHFRYATRAEIKVVVFEVDLVSH